MIKTYEKFNLRNILPKKEEYEILSSGIYKFCKKVTDIKITKEKDSHVIKLYFEHKGYKYKIGVIEIARFIHVIEITLQLFQDDTELKKIFKYLKTNASELGLDCDPSFTGRYIKMKYEEVDKFLNSLSVDEFEMFDETQKYNL